MKVCTCSSIAGRGASELSGRKHVGWEVFNIIPEVSPMRTFNNTTAFGAGSHLDGSDTLWATGGRADALPENWSSADASSATLMPQTSTQPLPLTPIMVNATTQSPIY